MRYAHPLTHMALILSFSFSSKYFASKTHSFKTDENWGKNMWQLSCCLLVDWVFFLDSFANC